MCEWAVLGVGRKPRAISEHRSEWIFCGRMIRKDQDSLSKLLQLGLVLLVSGGTMVGAGVAAAAAEAGGAGKWWGSRERSGVSAHA